MVFRACSECVVSCGHQGPLHRLISASLFPFDGSRPASHSLCATTMSLSSHSSTQSRFKRMARVLSGEGDSTHPRCRRHRSRRDTRPRTPPPRQRSARASQQPSRTPERFPSWGTGIDSADVGRWRVPAGERQRLTETSTVAASQQTAVSPQSVLEFRKWWARDPTRR